MEAFGGEASGQAGGFAEIIRGIEKDCERSLLDRKNQLLFKQQLKENWLSRTKIIPPSFPKIQPSQASPAQAVLRPINTAENGSSNWPRSEEECRRPAREGCKTSHAAGRNIASCKRLRSNWKLQFRKDQLNILRYKYSREKEGFQPQATGKSFKVRRVFRRLEEGRQERCANMRGFYEFSEEKLGNSRERLKTAELSPTHKHRFFA